jgi:hypothetical protein
MEGILMNRRKFFAFLPFAPVSAVMATAAVAKAPCESFAPDTALMTLKAHKPPPPPKPAPKHYYWDNKFINNVINDGYQSINKLTIGTGLEIKANKDFDEEIQVSMSVGKDGHLWLKIGDSWKRIVTE